MKIFGGKLRVPRGPSSGNSSKQKKKKLSNLLQATTCTEAFPNVTTSIHGTTPNMAIPSALTLHQVSSVAIDHCPGSNSEIQAEATTLTELPIDGHMSTSVVGHRIKWKKRSYRPNRDKARYAERMACNGGIPPERNGEGDGRGPNKPEKLKPKDGESRWKIFFSATYRPLGTRTKKLAEYIGDQARNHHHFPIYKRWGQHQNRQLVRVLKETERYYEFIGPKNPNPEGMECRLPLDRYALWIYFKKAFQKALREWRHKVKKEFYERWLEASHAERKIVEKELTDTCRIPLVDWPAICEYFENDKVKEESARNTVSRNAKTDRPTSTSGSVSHARTCEILMETMADDYDDMYGFDYCHTSKDPITNKRVCPDEQTKRYLDKLHHKAQEKGLVPSRAPGASNLTPILEEVSGKHRGGYEVGLGLGPSKMILKDSYARSMLDSIEEERKSWMSEREGYEKKIDESAKRIAFLETRIEELTEAVARTTSIHSAPSTTINPFMPSEYVNSAMHAIVNTNPFINADWLRHLFSGVPQDSGTLLPAQNMGMNTSFGEALATRLTESAYFRSQGQGSEHRESPGESNLGRESN